MKFRDQKNYLVSSKGYRMKMGFINKINLQNDGRTLNRFIEIEKNEIMGILEQLIDIIYLNITQKIGQAPGSQYDWHFF